MNEMDSCIAGSTQERCNVLSNKMKTMSIKNCRKKDFFEKNIQDLQPAEVGATKCSQNRATRRAGV